MPFLVPPESFTRSVFTCCFATSLNLNAHDPGQARIGDVSRVCVLESKPWKKYAGRETNISFFLVVRRTLCKQYRGSRGTNRATRYICIYIHVYIFKRNSQPWNLETDGRRALFLYRTRSVGVKLDHSFEDRSNVLSSICILSERFPSRWYK